MRRTRVLITGSTGFVGRQVVKALPANSTMLRLLVRVGKEKDARVLREDVEIVSTNDLFSETVEWWKLQFSNIDVVIHTAWHADPQDYLTSQKNIDCLIGSLVMAKGAIEAGVKRFIGVGTCFEYDLTGGMLSVETPLKPLTLYAAAKTALFINLNNLAPKVGLEFAWCRLFYLYGEGENSRRLVAYLRFQIERGEQVNLTSGKQVRDFLDVKDAGEKIANVAIGNQIGPINICSGIGITVRQLAEKIADEYGRRDLLKFGLRKDNLIDPACVIGIKNYL